MSNGTTIGLSRRGVLRKGAVAAGAAGLGSVALSGPARASDCPRTPGYWANHDWCTVPTDPSDPDGPSVAESIGLTCEADGTVTGTYDLARTDVARTMDEWQAFLVGPAGGDKAVIMARTVLATALNWQRRPKSDADCVDAPVDLSRFGLGRTTMRCVYRAALSWVNASAFGDSGVTQTAWAPPTVELGLGCTVTDREGTGSATVGGEPLKDALDAFNNATLGLDCDCDGGDVGDAGGGRGKRNGRDEGRGRGRAKGRDRSQDRGRGRRNP